MRLLNWVKAHKVLQEGILKSRHALSEDNSVVNSLGKGADVPYTVDK